MLWPTLERWSNFLSQLITLPASLCMALNLERGDFVGVLVQAVLGGVTVSMNERPELFDRIYVKGKVTILSLA